MKAQEFLQIYSVSTRGEVTNKITGRNLKWDVSTHYAKVTLSDNKKKLKISV